MSHKLRFPSPEETLVKILEDAPGRQMVAIQLSLAMKPYLQHGTFQDKYGTKFSDFIQSCPRFVLSGNGNFNQRIVSIERNDSGGQTDENVAR